MIMWWSSDYHLIIIWLSSDYHLIIIWWLSKEQLRRDWFSLELYLLLIIMWSSCDYHLTIIQWSQLIKCCFVINQQTSKQTNKQQTKQTYKQTNILNMMIMWLSCDYHEMIIICSYNGHSMTRIKTMRNILVWITRDMSKSAITHM